MIVVKNKLYSKEKENEVNFKDYMSCFPIKGIQLSNTTN